MKTTSCRITVTVRSSSTDVTATTHVDGRISDEDLAYLGRLTKATTPLRTAILIQHLADLISVVKGTVQTLTLFPDESLIPSEESQRWMDKTLERIKAWDTGRKRFVVASHEEILGIIDPSRPDYILVLADFEGMGHQRSNILSGDHRPATVEEFERFRVSITAYENDLEYKTPK